MGKNIRFRRMLQEDVQKIDVYSRIIFRPGIFLFRPEWIYCRPAAPIVQYLDVCPSNYWTDKMKICLYNIDN